MKKMIENRQFSVFVGGLEVTDSLVSDPEAQDVAKYYEQQGYEDISIVEYEQNITIE